MEHKYSRKSYNALQNYCQMIQLAHLINQFTEKSSDFIELLNQYSKQTIKALWKEILTFMKSIPYTPAQLQEFISG